MVEDREQSLGVYGMVERDQTSRNDKRGMGSYMVPKDAFHARGNRYLFEKERGTKREDDKHYKEQAGE